MDRYVRLQIKVLQRNLHINIQNPTDGQMQKFGTADVTSKFDKSMHGFGLRSVEKIVVTHQGYTNIKHADNVFSVSILLPIENASAMQQLAH